MQPPALVQAAATGAAQRSAAAMPAPGAERASGGHAAVVVVPRTAPSPVLPDAARSGMQAGAPHSDPLTLDYAAHSFGRGQIVHADCFEWLARVPECCLHAIVTDPPYGLREYDDEELEKRARGAGGVWRLPPAFDGAARAPLPRFTALDGRDRERLARFFTDWSRLALRALKPGGHVIVATNAFIAALLYEALVRGGLEFRGQLIRQVRTLRGGDRPKNAELEFPGVSSMPRGCFEPWGLLRKPLPAKMTLGDCLRQYQTGGLRRLPGGNPFEDVIASERTPRSERAIAGHPSLKPQSFMRRIVYAALPLGRGLVADPFMGAGSTIAAAQFLGLQSIGVERQAQYFAMAAQAIPMLAGLGAASGAPVSVCPPATYPDAGSGSLCAHG